MLLLGSIYHTEVYNIKYCKNDKKLLSVSQIVVAMLFENVNVLYLSIFKVMSHIHTHTHTQANMVFKVTKLLDSMQ